MDSTPNTQNANTEPASEGNITLTPQETQNAPQETQEPAREPVQYDDDFINKIESAVEARLQKKLYAGRKQEKIDKKAHKEAIKNLDFMDKSPSLLQSVVALGMVGVGIAVYGFYLLNKEKKNETNAQKATESASGI
ncbi:hypothetical protein [uncultured Helicobacter sp.]|uniref:hypothetical protein n=1 Tax=uncultured Helicobacter sp. TaxID=175537 RepID=UPI002607F208|nr:hypothetical protein [uncultured Helicobacter sp.]